MDKQQHTSVPKQMTLHIPMHSFAMWVHGISIQTTSQSFMFMNLVHHWHPWRKRNSRNIQNAEWYLEDVEKIVEAHNLYKRMAKLVDGGGKAEVPNWLESSFNSYKTISRTCNGQYLATMQRYTEDSQDRGQGNQWWEEAQEYKFQKSTVKSKICDMWWKSLGQNQCT